MVITSELPTEVELALELMPCQALRRSYDSAPKAHPCAYFAEWGYYHTYDYPSAGPPDKPSTDLPVVYTGKRQVVPEMLSGCRKAPIMCVGINPNLPGWESGTESAIHPYFDDVLQYAHYFRYRTVDKRRIPQDKYEDLLGSEVDKPQSARPLQETGKVIAAERDPVLMYTQYQKLLDKLMERKAWPGQKLAVGEDIAYGNMVACPSTHWLTTEKDKDYPDMPVMGASRGKGLVQECFHKRRYFLRQLTQSLPAVIIVLSQTAAREFIRALQGRFSMGNPQPEETVANLFQREIRLEYGRLSDGKTLDARVIFLPHASAHAANFNKIIDKCVDQFDEEIVRGNLVYNSATGHLQRSRGACVFCANALYKIGECDYKNELKPLAAGAVRPLADGARPLPDSLADKKEQLALLESIVGNGVAISGTTAPQLKKAPASMPAPLALRGKVVPMVGAPMNDAIVYVRAGRIQAISQPEDPVPDGFAGVGVLKTDGVIYPGLLDLHNHMAYNVLPLWNWRSSAPFDNRKKWLGRPEYRRDVSEPMKVLKASGQDIVRAVVRYVEVKLLLGGVTTGQGMNTSFEGKQYYSGLVRNFELADESPLPSADTHVRDITLEDLNTLRSSLDKGNPLFLHLAEGVDLAARQQFLLLQEHKLLRKNLICIHGLALNPPQHKALAESGAPVVWSPLSNLLLYGQTIDPRVLKKSRTSFALGSDWTPSGSKNILQELKAAWLCNENADGVLSAERLAKSVTIDAARCAGWDSQLGSIEAGKLADLMVLDNKVEDPFQNLIHATEREVKLVVIGGQARHGDRALMEGLGLPAGDMEAINVGGRQKRLFLRDEGSLLSTVSFSRARDLLKESMANLGGLRNAPKFLFQRPSDEPALELVLDMQLDEAEDAILLADLPKLQSLELDGPTVIDDGKYFDRLDAIPHVPDFLKVGLCKFYR